MATPSFTSNNKTRKFKWLSVLMFQIKELSKEYCIYYEKQTPLIKTTYFLPI